jgi:hypothetical protein
MGPLKANMLCSIIQAASVAPGAFNPDSLFTSSRVGDFFQPSGFYEDGSPWTDPADTAGDLVYTAKGSRTVAGPMSVDHPDQATVGTRPSVASDGTHGLVLKNTASTAKYLLGLNGSQLQTGMTNNGATYAARIKVTTSANIGANGHSVLAYDRNSGGLFIVSGTLYFGANTGAAISQSLSSYDGQWISIVATRTSSNDCAVYINDPDTPVVTGNPGSFGGTSRVIVGQPVAAGASDLFTYKLSLIDDVGGATVAQWMSWLEA